MSVKISVVIPTYNRVDKLQEVLPTLLNQTMHPDDYEILQGKYNVLKLKMGL